MLEYSRFDPEVLFAIRPAVVPGFSLRLKRNDAWVASAVCYRDRSSTFTWHSARSPLMASSIRRGTDPLRLAKVVIVRPDIPSALAAAGRVRPSLKTIFSLAKSS